MRSGVGRGGGLAGLVIAALVGLGVAVAIVVIGVHQQESRRIRNVSAVSISVPGRDRPLLRLGRKPAEMLAGRVNALGTFPDGEVSCGGATRAPLVLRFTSADGVIRVERARDGCQHVEIFSGGQSWGTNKWDGSGDLIRAINRYLRAAKLR